MEELSQFEKRFGKDVAAAGVTAIPDVILRYAGKVGLTPAELGLVTQVFAFQWDDRFPHPSSKVIAARLGVSRKTVQKLIASLKGKGLLKRGGKDRQTTTWNFNPLIRKCMEMEQRSKKQLKAQENQEDKSKGVTTWVTGVSPRGLQGVSPRGLHESEEVKQIHEADAVLEESPKSEVDPRAGGQRASVPASAKRTPEPRTPPEPQAIGPILGEMGFSPDEQCRAWGDRHGFRNIGYWITKAGARRVLDVINEAEEGGRQVPVKDICRLVTSILTKRYGGLKGG